MLVLMVRLLRLKILQGRLTRKLPRCLDNIHKHSNQDGYSCDVLVLGILLCKQRQLFLHFKERCLVERLNFAQGWQAF